MAKIKQLSALEAQKIAAGEVVERPANVVKELIENALDAGASTITLYLENGGKSFIRCVDNGSGMSVADARACILHHATSKISTADDLNSLTTFGFRGEALSSIAAVSHLSIITKESIAESGIHLQISQGSIIEERQVAANTGTDISLTDLFFNMPARKKFLKTKETEWRAVVHLFQAFCLAYKEVSFKLYHEQKLVYNYPSASSLSERLGQVFEASCAKSILEHSLSQSSNNISCVVACTTPDYNRYDKNALFVFVNNRWVKNYKLVQAFIKGYGSMLPPSKYPAGCVFLTVDQQSIDVNIHPRKEEVQFSHPRLIENLIEAAVQEKLEQHHSHQLGKTVSFEPQRHTTPETITGRFSEPVRISPTAQENEPHILKNEQLFLEKIAPFFNPQEKPDSNDSCKEGAPLLYKKAAPPTTSHTLPADLAVPPLIPRSDDETMNFRLIGQLARTYILIETEKGLVLIDQHAAHERILYEKFSARFDNPGRIKLLVPQIIVLTKEDASLLSPYISLLNSFGVEAHFISDYELSIEETSIHTKNRSLEECIKQIISVVREHAALEEKELKAIIHEKLHASMSCKAAVKAGDLLSFESMHQLVTDLSTTNRRLSCPHGRPTLWELSKQEIEKKFKRDYRSNS